MCKLRNSIYVVLFMFLMQYSMAQVGINTTTPDPSSMLDVSSTTKGMLTPRMTTAQKSLIASPANGLLVYDTDYKEFSYYDAVAGWINIKQGRTNFKRIKSTDVLANVLAAELLAGGGTKYVMSANTLYEINGTVLFNLPIEMNNSYISGLDSGDDKIVRTTGNIFDGATGGTIKGLTLVAAAGKVFNISGANTENIIFRDCIVANSSDVGSIDGLGLVFFSVVQFSGNTTGIVYSNISQLLLSNMGWFGNNSGTFEKLTGTFGLVQKQGGFSDVTSCTFAFDVAANPTITGDAVLESVVFTGPPAKFVNKYTGVGTYTGYNFNNKWNVRSTGIPNETDANATGNLYYQSSSVVNLNSTTAFKLPVNTNSIRLFRTAEGSGVNSENRLIYEGDKRRALNVLGALSFTATAGSRYIFSIYKNGVKVIGSDVEADVSVTNARQSVSIIGTVDVVKNDYIEIYMQKPASGLEAILITSYNLIFN